MQQRDTYLITEPGKNLDTHLWVVISDPSKYPDQVICLNISSSEAAKNDPACVLEECDHDWITRRSYVFYAGPHIVSNDDLDRFVADGLITTQKPMSQDVFDRVVGGTLDSKSGAALGIAEMMEKQGLICF